MPNEPRRVPAISGLLEIADRYDAALCDVWGVLHNGREAFKAASDALVAFRALGKTVILITNAPRPNAPIVEQVQRFGVARAAFDAVVTSGDVTMALIAERIDQPCYHIGPERDLTLFTEASKLVGRPARLVGLEDAAYVLCTGLFDDDTEGPEDYDSTYAVVRKKKLPFICANPDLVVHRGERLLYCAGALAERLIAQGGEVIYSGKPHAPIYHASLQAADKAAGRSLDRKRILAIGDGMRTDITGALAQGLDVLFVAAGIHFDELGDPAGEQAALEALFHQFKLWPTATLKHLKA